MMDLVSLRMQRMDRVSLSMYGMDLGMRMGRIDCGSMRTRRSGPGSMAVKIVMSDLANLALSRRVDVTDVCSANLTMCKPINYLSASQDLD